MLPKQVWKYPFYVKRFTRQFRVCAFAKEIKCKTGQTYNLKTSLGWEKRKSKFSNTSNILIRRNAMGNCNNRASWKMEETVNLDCTTFLPKKLVHLNQILRLRIHVDLKNGFEICENGATSFVFKLHVAKLHFSTPTQKQLLHVYFVLEIATEVAKQSIWFFWQFQNRIGWD